MTQPLDEPDVTPTPVFFSIVSANYLAYAVTLMQTVRHHHPAAHRFVILADELRDDLEVDPELFTLVPVRELALPHPEHFAFRYSILEFNTAIKPFAARWLAERHPHDAVIYLDPDIHVASPLVEVIAALEGGGLAVVTPHLTAPLDDDKRPDELSIMRVGAYNLGFIALGAHPRRRAMLDWWASKLEFQARIEFESGLFTDQKWIDLLPGLFPDVVVLRHPGYNLAYWNLPHRDVTADGPQLRVNGDLLVFVHFSGIDLKHPEWFSKYQNRYDRSSIAALGPLYEDYLARLRDNGHDRYSRIPYAWSRLRDGTVLTAEMRGTFRERFDIGRPEEIADPFGLTRLTFAQTVPVTIRFSRFVLRQYPRLQTWRPIRWALNRIKPQGRRALRRVFTRKAALPGSKAARDIADSMTQVYPTARPSGAESRPRANLIGYFKGEFGVAEAGRAIARAAEVGGVDVALVNVDAPEAGRGEDLRFAAKLGDIAVHPINVLCVNADQTPFVMGVLGRSVVDGRYNVGFWFWELGKFPLEWQASIDRVDEIWTATDFAARSVAGATSKPVRVVRLPIDATPTRTYRRVDFDLRDDAFTFLFSFDFNSFIARKNPRAVVEAFLAAFPESDSTVALVLKSTNGARNRTQLDDLRATIAGDPRIRLLDRFMTRDQVYGLESVVDSYVSLHRSEGFGLGLAESMFQGKPVIGTGYSGNMEFMNAGNSCVVGYELVPVAPGEYPHPDGQHWAEPDLDHAAYHMRRLAGDPAFGVDLGRRARADIQRDFSDRSIGERVAGELRRILDGLPAS